ncbi:MAG: hypothetical protein ACYCWC_05245 [Rhodocyclaceae bacterium]
MAAARLDLVFLWHMHQPDYRDHASGTFVMPWTYLRAIKDYTDMAAHLERHPDIHAVVNFVPVLLDQIDDYIGQFASGDFRDPLLRLLARDDFDALSPDERKFLFETCFRCNHATMLAPFPRYRRLHELHESLTREGEVALAYLSGAYLADLVTWYHLVWTGETERRRWDAQQSASADFAKTDGGELGVWHFFHLDRRPGQEPRLGSVVRRQAQLRPGD